MPKPLSPTQNHLLGALDESEREHLFSQLELVPMRLGEVIYESGTALDMSISRPTASFRCCT
jgi:hypothetical protein